MRTSDQPHSPERRLLVGLGLAGVATGGLARRGFCSDMAAAPISHAMDDLLRATASAYGTVGYSAAVLRRGKLVHLRHDGLADRDSGTPITPASVYPLFSISKLFLVIELLKAVERGQIDLAMPLGIVRPDLPIAWQSITLEQAIAHVSGLPDYIPDHVAPTVDQAFTAIHSLPLRFPPGTSNDYNQTNFLFAHEALKQATGASISSLSRAQFRAAGMQVARYYSGVPDKPFRLPGLVSSYRPTRRRDGPPAPYGLPTWPDYTFGSTGVFATLNDMIGWSRALYFGALLPLDILHASWKPFPMVSGVPAWHSHGWEYAQNGDVTIVGHGGENRLVWRHFFRTADHADSATVIYLDNGGRSAFDRHRVAALLAEYVMPGAARAEEAQEEALFRALAVGRWETAVDRLIATHSATRVEAIVNRVGYDARFILDVDTALGPFEWNVRRFPKSSNAHDSLGEAYLAAGRRDDARVSYRVALELDPGNPRIKGVLAELSGVSNGN
ncbi:hypothetical protein DMC47_26290 [Nostoc sp. 3335mG]|nr:hypothetical protein DMC47_26290 [Nostoc sp. 3335mG]